MRSHLRSLAIPVLLVTMLAVSACSLSPEPPLTGKAWEWVTGAGDVPGSLQSIPNPDRYTIEFMADGSFSAKADCNQVNGQYTTGDGGAMTITLGPSTLVACPADSLADLFVAGLAGTVSYAIVDEQLNLTTADDKTLTLD